MRTGGFTIIEMLASLIIIGLASAMMFSGLQTGRRVWERADVADAAGEAVSGAQMLLRGRIERIYPATRYDKVPTYADFDGIATGIIFLAPARDIRAPTGLQRYKLVLMPNGDLVLQSQVEMTTDPTRIDEQLVLLHNVQQFNASYFGTLPPDKVPAWHDVWEGRATLPLLVRIRVQFPPDDPRIWPELLVKPFATVDSMCVLTVMTGKCRGRQ